MNPLARAMHSKRTRKDNTTMKTIDPNQLEQITGGVSGRWLRHHPVAAAGFLANHPRREATFMRNHPIAGARIQRIQNRLGL